jgi:hypothetical protein
VAVLERRGHEAPHALVAAEAVREQQGGLAAAAAAHVESAEWIHPGASRWLDDLALAADPAGA